jgi:CheY-like chemotaxis protein
MSVVLLTGDLTVISRVQGAASRAGANLRAVLGAAQAIDCCLNEPVEFLILDLSAASLDAMAIVEQLKAAPNRPRVIAFGPHVHEERLQAARKAGCDEVVSRGQFFAQVEGMLAR